jgi:hypothetical protein
MGYPNEKYKTENYTNKQLEKLIKEHEIMLDEILENLKEINKNISEIESYLNN